MDINKVKHWFKRLSHPLVITIATIALLASSVYAVTYLNVITTSVTITEGLQSVVVYDDVALTNEITELSVTSLEPGQAWVKDLYVVNEGGNSISVGIMAEGNTAFGMIMFAPTESFTLSPGAFQVVEVSIYALPSATSGNYNFSIILYDSNS